MTQAEIVKSLKRVLEILESSKSSNTVHIMGNIMYPVYTYPADFRISKLANHSDFYRGICDIIIDFLLKEIECEIESKTIPFGPDLRIFKNYLWKEFVELEASKGKIIPEEYRGLFWFPPFGNEEEFEVALNSRIKFIKYCIAQENLSLNR